MKKTLLLAAFIPGILVANALRQGETAPSKPAQAAPAKNLRSPKDRWQNIAKSDEASFRRHVVPLMSRAGCSGRECHGAFSGRGGFQLSLFGYDFDKDHKEITADQEDGPRVDLKDPVKSLVLTKPSLDNEEHKGKKRFDKGSWEYNMILRWIKDGAKIDVEETGAFARLEVTPAELQVRKPGDSVQLRVLAHWKDGSVEDVTQITRFRTNDDSVAVVSDTGLVTAKGMGDTHIVAFYDNGVHPVPVIFPMSDRFGANFPAIKARTKVDEFVLSKLRKAGIEPSEICTDAEFLRRVSLDMTATPPSPEQVRAFLADKSPDKRAKKIEELLKSPGYAAWWTTLLCDFTGNNPRQLNTGGELQLNNSFSRQWYDWIYKRIADNVPYDQMVAGIVLASGRTKSGQSYEEYAKEMGSYFRANDPVDFATRETMPYFWQRQNVRKPQEKALAFAHTFLGVRIECAECHKHPFDQWTQTDFKQFQAFFEPVDYGGRRGDGVEMDYNALTKQLREKAGYNDKDKKQNNRDEFRKLLQTMMRNGEVVPWQEVYVQPAKSKRQLSEKEIARIKAKNPTADTRVFTPKILGGGEVELGQFPDPRGPLMDWLRSQENPYFARAWVNRVWAVYFGRGIVEPADDMNLASPPTNKELMDYLATGFVKSGFDMKWLHREITRSDTYQRSWKTTPSNKLDEKNFSHALIRRLPAEVVFDSLAAATSSESGLVRFLADLDNRAIGPNATINGKTKGGDGYTLTTFGKPARLTNCDCERTADPTLLQTIFTRNDPAFMTMLDSSKRDGMGWIEELRRAMSPDFSADKIRGELTKIEGGIDKMKLDRAEREQAGNFSEKDLAKFESRMAEGTVRLAKAKEELARAEARKPVDIDRAIEDVFLRTVARFPTREEFTNAKADVAAASAPVEGIRELLWAMLNTREFMVNH